MTVAVKTKMTLEEKRDKLCKDKQKESDNPILQEHYINGVLDMYNATKRDER